MPLHRPHSWRGDAHLHAIGLSGSKDGGRGQAVGSQQGMQQVQPSLHCACLFSGVQQLDSCLGLHILDALAPPLICHPPSCQPAPIAHLALAAQDASANSHWTPS